jgi:hypothetical protein|tara:strand:+ start:164 stop:844 length:681 start_codon:yes stop_codon:yes gene_type:complete
MDNFLVLYRPGLGGTWLSHFINSHKNFAQYPLYTKARKRGVTTDVGCNGIDWNIEEDFYTTFVENRKNAHTRYAKNLSHKKDCVKVLNNHGLSIEIGNRHDIVNLELLHKVCEEIKPNKIIVPVLKEHLLDEFILRWKAFEQWHYEAMSVSDWRKEWSNWIYYLMNEKPYHDQPYAEVYYCDIGKLISDDGEEYILLCEAIGEETNDNAREQLDWYKDIILRFKNL